MNSTILSRFALALVLFCTGIPLNTSAQKEVAQKKIEQLIAASGSDVGVAILGIEDRDSLTFNGRRHYPMQSVFKFPLAMAVLHHADAGKYTLDQLIPISEKELFNTWSPMMEKYGNKSMSVKLSELLSYTVSQSDNVGCDVLIRLAGGTKKVEKYIHHLGIREIDIASTEREMHSAWNAQFANWSEPWAMARLLDLAYTNKGNILSAGSHAFLWKIMTETTTGPKRLKGLLPQSALIAHKTGTGPTDDKGITSATNDVGVVTLPNGKHYAIVVFVANSPKNEAERERLIAEINRAAWDYFTAKN